MSDRTVDAQAGLEKCQRLLANADFVWFMESAVKKPLREKDAELKALGTDKDAREIAAHVRDALETASEFLPKQQAVYERTLAAKK